MPLAAMLAAADAIIQRAIPSERKSAECCERAVKAPFGCLRVPLPANASLHFRLPQAFSYISTCEHG